ncbi:RNA-binding protein [Patescibacteria group bacterium]|nr:RNA-binding protein [Patescibacteria group bacterium]
MGKKLYVGNLSYQMTSEELGQTFSEAGQVEDAAVITDRQTGRSRGFGFVTMSSEEEAKKAIELFHNKEVEGRSLVVNEARDPQPRN